MSINPRQAPATRSREGSSPARRANGPGRRVTRNADRMKSEILSAAFREFSVKGLSGARIDEIAAKYGGSKNMIYHYFGSKDGLFAAVLENMYRTIRARQRDLEIKSQDPVAGIRALVQFTIDVFNDHPEFVTLLHSENMARAKHVRKSTSIVAMYNPLVATIEDLLARGAASGVFRKGESAVDLYICICAMATYPISNRYTLSAIFDIDINAPARRKLRNQQIADMVVGYLSAAASARRQNGKR